ncbi:MAG: (2Fe-2S) ferredoxin domain-containing protein [Bosea sp. (in: a-proteobacteria)]|nr:(2Fe-2S) ferredoxin domain-containing protein [Bosea sp. (in: a-proteobacteria)]
MPIAEMERLRSLAAARADGAWVAYAFTEQGTPSLRDVVLGLLGEPVSEILFVPLLLPMEPSFAAWLTRTLQRWRAEHPGPWPVLRIGAGLSQGSAVADVLSEQIHAAGVAAPVAHLQKATQAGSLVPPQKRRVLVCQGGPCMAAGADVIWGHLRNEQARQNLREAGEGTMSAKTSCLGPCNLAPVIQVWPEGTVYGGVDEAGVDAIIAEHLLEGRIVARLAYAPTGRKQMLRPSAPSVDGAIDGLSQPATVDSDHGSSESIRS